MVELSEKWWQISCRISIPYVLRVYRKKTQVSSTLKLSRKILFCKKSLTQYQAFEYSWNKKKFYQERGVECAMKYDILVHFRLSCKDFFMWLGGDKTLNFKKLWIIFSYRHCDHYAAKPKRDLGAKKKLLHPVLR